MEASRDSCATSRSRAPRNSHGESRSATTSSAGPTLVASNEDPHRPGHAAQTDFAIAPVSVAGVVTVKDALDVAFTIVAVDRPSS